jgi:hypothetical protein
MPIANDFLLLLSSSFVAIIRTWLKIPPPPEKDQYEDSPIFVDLNATASVVPRSDSHSACSFQSPRIFWNINAAFFDVT